SELGVAKVTSNFDLIFRSDSLTVTDPQYQAAVADALAPIQGDPRISKLVSPYNAPNTTVAQAFTSKDGHEALVSVELTSSGQQAWKDYDYMRGKVHSSTLAVTGTGFVAINQAFNKTLESDLQRAETVTLPVTLILLVLIFQGTFLASMGAAGAIVVAFAVLYALTFLPALLAVLGPRVNRWRLPFMRGRTSGGGFWSALATWVMKRPIVVLVPTVAFLVIAATPFLQLRLANGNVDMLPTHIEARQGYDRLVADFQGQDQTTF